MVPSRMAGGMAQSSSSSGIFFQGERQPQGNSQLSSDFGNITNSIPGHARANMGPLYADMLNSVPSSGPSIGGSSLVTDANSGLSAGPHLQRSASINNESYIRLPASPLSFSSNNLSISGSSIIDAHQNSIQEHGSQQSQHQRVPNSFFQDMGPMSQLQKKPRLEINQEDVLQQLLQRQDSMNLQSSNPQLQALIQQQRLRQQNQQQQQLLQSMPPMQRIQLLQQQQQNQQQIKQQQQLLQQGLQPASGLKRPYDSGVCSRRLMQYLYHQRPRPFENTIAYWRKFVSEYYSPRAKKRWCLSRYDNVGRHSLGVFPQAAMDAWQCDICGSKSGRGFEATFEVLPRLNEIKFSSGVIDELLFLDLPREFRFPSGVMVLEYAKAVQESVYEQLRVIREGQLRIIFSPDLKIISWEFCARHHEELLPRRLVASQVNQLLQVAQKCQSTISESGSGGVSQPEMQANGVMVVTAGLQLARSLESQSLNDLGFSKRYVRCLQIAEVVNFMKDLMDFCKDQKFGPMDGLKKFLQQSTGPKTQIQKGSETEMGGLQGPTIDQNMLNNKPLALQSVPNSPMNNNQHVGGQGPSNGTAQGAVVLSNYQNLLTRQNSMNSNHSSLGFSSPFGTSSQPPQTSQVQQQNQSLPPQGSSQASLQQQMMQQLLQDMSNKNNNNNNNGGLVQQQSTSGQNPGNSVSRDGLGLRSSTVNNNTAAGNGTGNVVGHAPNRSNSFKAASNGGTPVPGENVVFGHKAPGLPHTSDEMDQDIARDFMEYGFFNNDLDDNMNFSWKV